MDAQHSPMPSDGALAARKVLQGQEKVSCRPQIPILSVEVLMNNALLPSGKHLTLGGKARECEPNKGW